MDSQTSLLYDGEILPNFAEKASPAINVEQVPDESYEARFKCIRAYEQFALQQADPLHACLAIVNCGLIDFVAVYHSIIKQSFTNGVRNLADLRQFSAAMDSYLKLVRQTDRFAQMEIRLRESGKHSDASVQVANLSNAGLVPMQSEEMTD